MCPGGVLQFSWSCEIGELSCEKMMTPSRLNDAVVANYSDLEPPVGHPK